MFLATIVLIAAQSPAPAEKWEKEIAAIETRIATEAPGGIVFAGSSSIRLWDLKKSFPDWPTVNVGFGGSQIAESTRYYGRIIKPLKPKAIVFYAGDNDIAAKKSAEQVAADYSAFVAAVRADFPAIPIYYLPIKASVKRWNLYAVQSDANLRIKQIIDKDPNQKYVDLVPTLLGADGKPDVALFKDDGLHLNEQGYAKWAAILKAAMK
jgi:lysophospholipase L1-like esterase